MLTVLTMLTTLTRFTMLTVLTIRAASTGVSHVKASRLKQLIVGATGVGDQRWVEWLIAPW